MNYESQLWKKEQENLQGHITTMRTAILRAYDSAAVASLLPDTHTTKKENAIRKTMNILAQLLFTPLKPGLSTEPLESDGEGSQKPDKENTDDMQHQVVAMHKAIIKAHAALVILLDAGILYEGSVELAERALGELSPFVTSQGGLTSLSADMGDESLPKIDKESTLTAFFRKCREEDKENEGEYKDDGEEWRAAMNILFGKIRVYLQEAEGLGLISIREGMVDLREERLAWHQLPVLLVRDGTRTLSIEPVCWNDGVNARVGMKYEGDGCLLILDDSNTWFFNLPWRLRPPLCPKSIPLNAETFGAVLTKMRCDLRPRKHGGLLAKKVEQ